ncbi:hypothetical protein [Rubellicoccus peritrichatus]|uniref:Uncharacterized protein n=1 Tax=Rubellicoccus peritrichatus TaxID=3080537 RepID=A0AAQ3LJ18_9BACT|nr:hypothetical protein [Puniceicoccus sp. CR14]WOO43054.1 hypothetical protein RZN69_08105 [Puniceicoccus sp. CR14]
MIRPKVLAFALLGLMPVFAFSARKKAVEEVPQISDQAALRLLSTPDVYQWERAKEQEKIAKSQIETGNRMVNRPASLLKSPEEIAQEKKDGKVMVEEGEAKLAAAMATLNRLRRTAIASQKDQTVVKDETVVYPFEFNPEVLDEAVFNTTEKLLFSLWNKGYGRIYFGGAYFIDTAADLPIFIEDPVLTDGIRGDIARLDGTRFTFVGDENTTYALKTENGRTVIDFPERTQILRHFKSVFVVAELVYDSRTDSALLSMRGIDLASMNVVSAQLSVIAVDEDLRQLSVTAQMDESETPASDDAEAADQEAGTEVASADNASEEVTIAESTEDEVKALATVYKRLAIQLKDNNNFLERVSSSGTPFVFSFEYLGDTKGFDSRAASMISKVILLESNLSVSDSDFLPQVLQFSEIGAGTEMEDTSNAIWKVTPLGGGRSGTVAYDVEAVSLLRAEPLVVPVGLMQTALVVDAEPKIGGS